MTSRDRGFSLIEVNLAVLLVSVGFMALFVLFPLGLKESEMGLHDTEEAMFADAVLSAVEAEALSITNWTVWKDEFTDRIRNCCYPLSASGLENSAVGAGVVFPEPQYIGSAPQKYIRYKLSIADIDDPAQGSGPGYRKEVVLYVKSGKYGSFEDNAQRYYTQLVFMGM